MQNNVHLLPKLDNYSVYKHDYEYCFYFGGAATVNFHFRNNETENMSVYQSNPVKWNSFPLSTL